MSETIRLAMTCAACPEQYDAFLGDRLVGYLRLRHGSFTVQCPDVKGVEVYWATPEGDGAFTTDERPRYLQAARAAISCWLRLEADRVVACVYCGHQYSSGTPAAQDAALPEHIAKCEKHPLRAANLRIAALEAIAKHDDDLRERMAFLLTHTAGALKGRPERLHTHSWADLPSLAAAQRRELERLRAALGELELYQGVLRLPLTGSSRRKAGC